MRPVARATLAPRRPVLHKSAIMKRVIITADDFGLSDGVNEAVERGHREGILTSASLMVAGPACADAVARARRLPGLRVGLHLVLVEGKSVVPHAQIPDLVTQRGWFGSDPLTLSVKYAVSLAARRQLAAEIRAQFSAFAATGLHLDHADAHMHMQLHPTIGALMLKIGREFGLPAIRIPAEPPSVLARCGEKTGPGAMAMCRWSGLLRAQARRAGIATNDRSFGIAWSGDMTAPRLRKLAANLPDGLSEIYLHPATHRDGLLQLLMPGYDHEAEFAALIDPAVRTAFEMSGASLSGFT